MPITFSASPKDQVEEARPVPSRGPRGGVALVLDSPSIYNYKMRRHFWGDEEKVMTAIFHECGAYLEETYWTYVFPDYQGPKFKPKGDLLRFGSEAIYEELEKVRPTKILAMGPIATSALLKRDKLVNINNTRGISFEIQLSYGPVYVVSTFPSYYAIGEDGEDNFRDLAFDIEKFFKRDRPEVLPDLQMKIPRDLEELSVDLIHLSTHGVVSCDTETTGFNPREDTILALGFGTWDPQEGVSRSLIVTKDLLYQEKGREILKKFFQVYSKTGTLVFHNAKFDLSFLYKYLDISPFDWRVHDTMLMNYILDERPIGGESEPGRGTYTVSPHGLKTISRVRYDAEDYHFDFKGFYSLPEEERDYASLHYYLSLDLYYTARIHRDLTAEIQEEDPEYWHLLDMMYTTTKAFVEVEDTGLLVNVEHLQKMASDLEDFLEGLMWNIKDQLRSLGVPQEMVDKFNPNSPKALSKILYEIIGMPRPHRIDKSSESQTDKDSLRIVSNSEGIKGTIREELIDNILKYREQSKTLNTYVKGLLNGIHPDHRIRADFHVNGTSTGRLSCSKPNLQNQPVLQGPLIRQGFIAPEGYVFFTADYSQLELRVAALYSQDPNMIKAYVEDRDIHREVAAAMFKKPPEEITYEERYAAKFVDFGVLYGRGAESLATGRELVEYHWTLEEATAFINNYLGEFSKLKEWMDGQRQYVVDNHYTKTIQGRRRRFPLITPKNRGDVQRRAINTPVQGQASDLCQSALGRLFPRLKAIDCPLILTVHDSIACYARKDRIRECVNIFFEEMVVNLPIESNVPIKIEIEIGDSWADSEKIKLEDYLEPRFYPYLTTQPTPAPARESVA